MKIKPGIMCALFLATTQSFAAQPAETNKSTGASAGLTELFPDKVVAKGKGFEIKRSKLDDAVSTIKANFASGGRTVPATALPRLEREMLDRLINIELLKGRTTDTDKAKGKENADKRFAEIKSDPALTEALQRQIKLMDMTEEEFHKRMIEEATSDVTLRRELRTEISDEAAKKFFDDNPAEFEEPEKVRVCHILFATQDPKTRAELTDEQKKGKKKAAEDVLKRAKAGEDFSKLAKEFSEDPGAKENNGEYKFSRDDPFVPEFKAASFSLNTNQISDIITTQYGYHIIKLIEKYPAKKKTLEESSKRIKEYLEAKEMEKKLKGYFEQLKKDADVQILDEKLKSINLNAEEESAPPARPPAK